MASPAQSSSKRNNAGFYFGWLLVNVIGGALIAPVLGFTSVLKMGLEVGRTAVELPLVLGSALLSIAVGSGVGLLQLPTVGQYVRSRWQWAVATGAGFAGLPLGAPEILRAFGVSPRWAMIVGGEWQGMLVLVMLPAVISAVLQLTMLRPHVSVVGWLILSVCGWTLYRALVYFGVITLVFGAAVGEAGLGLFVVGAACIGAISGGLFGGLTGLPLLSLQQGAPRSNDLATPAAHV